MKMRFISAIRLTAAGVILLASSSLALAQSNDVEHGMQVFKQCAPCHATTNKTRVGPGLAGIVGRHAGSMPGFPLQPRDEERQYRLGWEDPGRISCVAAKGCPRQPDGIFRNSQSG